MELQQSLHLGGFYDLEPSLTRNTLKNSKSPLLSRYPKLTLRILQMLS